MLESRLQIVPISLEAGVDYRFTRITEMLKKTFGDDFLVLGGAVRDQFVLGKNKFGADIDVFINYRLYDRKKLEEAGFVFERTVGGHVDPYDWMQVITVVHQYRAPNQLTWKGDKKGTPVQIVLCDDVAMAFNSFDWTVCQFGWGPRHGFFATRQALESCAAKKLVLYKCHAFTKTVSRMVKLAKRLKFDVDEMSVNILHEHAKAKKTYQEDMVKGLLIAKDKDPVPLPKKISGQNSYFRKIDLKKAKKDGLVLNDASLLYHLSGLSPWTFNDLALTCIHADLPNITNIVKLVEGLAPKEASDFERSLVTRSEVTRLPVAMTDWELFCHEREALESDMDIVVNAVTGGVDRLIRAKDIAATVEGHSELRGLRNLNKAVLALRDLTVDAFEEGYLYTANEQHGGTTQVKLGKQLNKIAGIAEKLPERILVGKYTGKDGNFKESYYTLPKDDLTSLAVRARKMLRRYETRSTRQHLPNVEGVDFVVSNSVADLLTISTSGSWGMRNWSSCQSMNSDMGLYRHIAANTKHTLVAYLTRGNDWIGRILLRLNPDTRRVVAERYYGDGLYKTLLDECVNAHFGPLLGQGGQFFGFDFRPYSDCYYVKEAADFQPYIQADHEDGDIVISWVPRMVDPEPEEDDGPYGLYDEEEMPF